MNTRCDWCGDSPLYIDYHDNEWGVPEYDPQRLFEFLLLEGMQAGLSWITILKRREGIKQAFLQFDVDKLACLTDKALEKLLSDSRIIRNRLKVKAVRQNARALLELSNQYDVSDFLWQFTGGQVLNNNWQQLDQIPAQTLESQIMSKVLKKADFSFVGPTICYAFMQAVGMVNDHVVTCFRHRQIQGEKSEVIY